MRWLSLFHRDRYDDARRLREQQEALANDLIEHRARLAGLRAQAELILREGRK